MIQEFVIFATIVALWALPVACSDKEDVGTGGSGAAATSTGGGGSGGHAAGAGGVHEEAPCYDFCGGATPYCDVGPDTCVACLGSGHCTDPAAARCEAGSCVPCQDSAECEGVAEGQICDGGNCVECTVDDSSACGGGQTCDLIVGTCADVPPASVGTCESCSNDLQCDAGLGYRCVALDFNGAPHGHYCLRTFPPGCDQPFAVPLYDRASLNDASAADFCGVDETRATCEAVLALVNDWRCSGVDEMCSPDGIAPEQPVPGAVCQDLGGGALTNRCTYSCGDATACIDPAQSLPKSTCGGGPPDWCGGG